MNYYERHLGDYARDTGHLTLLEHGVYTLLLDRYYATEEPIPADQAYRLARARTEEERAAVDSVLSEFFTKQENPVGYVWVSGRVEEELAKARQRINRARENGKKGGRPSKSDAESHKQNPEETQKKPSGFSVGSISETQTKAHQSPDTIIPSSLRSEGKARKRATCPDRPEGVDESTWQDWLALRRAKKAPVTETVLRNAMAEADKAGLPLTKFLELWCARGSQGLQAEWLKPNERGPPAGRVPVNASFRDKTYEGDTDDELPDFLRAS